MKLASCILYGRKKPNADVFCCKDTLDCQKIMVFKMTEKHLTVFLPSTSSSSSGSAVANHEPRTLQKSSSWQHLNFAKDLIFIQ